MAEIRVQNLHKAFADGADAVEVGGLPDGTRVLRGSLGTVRDGTPARLATPAAAASR